ncbi:MAG TPA: hypothetical protein VIG24_12710 [Acidimicrobiia bacterium]
MTTTQNTNETTRFYETAYSGKIHRKPRCSNMGAYYRVRPVDVPVERLPYLWDMLCTVCAADDYIHARSDYSTRGQGCDHAVNSDCPHYD